MNVRIDAVFASLAFAALVLLAPLPAAADGQLGVPSTTPVGTFKGILYNQYDGLFAGQTSTGAYRVPYRITAPAYPFRSNRSVLVEPSHFTVGLGALGFHMGREFLLSHGFAHAGVGWSTASFASFGEGFDRRILDPDCDSCFIDGGEVDDDGRTDDEIIADFARALEVDANAKRMVGRVDRLYLTGFSDSSDPVLRLVASGHAAGVFDLVLPFTAEGHDPQTVLAGGLFGGKLMIVNSEAEATGVFVDGGGFPHQYRFYAVAGTPHVPDYFKPSFSNETTPASYHPALRAHFLQGHDWVRSSKRPPPSTHLATSDGEIARDTNGNAISVDAIGQPVPRLPFIELGEATFLTGFVGSYANVKTIEELGYGSHRAYLKAFRDKLAAYVKAGYMLKEDADAMRRRAALCPPLTFTETYRDHYEAFAAIVSCGG